MLSVQNAAAALVVLLTCYVVAVYCWKVVRRQIAPRIATWVIFEVGVVMSLASYLARREHSWVKAAMNVADGVGVSAILLVLLLEQRGQRVVFTGRELASLGISAVAALVWLVTRTGWAGFLGFQAVMTVAYWPTFESLWRWRPGPAPEPLEKWAVTILIAGLGVVVDLTGRHDYLAMVYPLRALVLCVTVVVLIVRWRWKSRVVSG